MNFEVVGSERAMARPAIILFTRVFMCLSMSAFGAMLACGRETSGPVPLFDPCKSPRNFLRDYQSRSRPGFLYGINYPWRIFAGDFGGIRAWRRWGVARSRDVHRRNFRLMKKHGVRVVRWWLWPDFRGDGIRFSSEGRALGLGPTVAADVNAALQLAEEFEIRLIFVIFSFDNFRRARRIGGVPTRSMSPMLRDAVQRRALLDNVVAPLARIVASSSRRDYLLAWELINEPEWAMNGRGHPRDRPYHPLKETDPVSHKEMVSFLKAMSNVLRRESRAPITIGQAALAWSNAFGDLDLDFYQFHVYEWMQKEWPLDRGPRAYGLGDKPVLIGELPLGPLGGRSFPKTVAKIRDLGFAGALPWSFSTLPRRRLRVLKRFPGDKCRRAGNRTLDRKKD